MAAEMARQLATLKTHCFANHAHFNLASLETFYLYASKNFHFKNQNYMHTVIIMYQCCTEKEGGL